ncbi:hypothetical protein J6590_042142 [Homalodisca vitripennis]|nr:hypothetical protein J6590_042142 [Homalodisca vitripennis]
MGWCLLISYRLSVGLATQQLLTRLPRGLIKTRLDHRCSGPHRCGIHIYPHLSTQPTSTALHTTNVYICPHNQCLQLSTQPTSTTVHTTNVYSSPHNQRLQLSTQPTSTALHTTNVYSSPHNQRLQLSTQATLTALLQVGDISRPTRPRFRSQWAKVTCESPAVNSSRDCYRRGLAARSRGPTRLSRTPLPESETVYTASTSNRKLY